MRLLMALGLLDLPAKWPQLCSNTWRHQTETVQAEGAQDPVRRTKLSMLAEALGYGYLLAYVICLLCWPGEAYPASSSYRDLDICNHWDGRRHFLELGSPAGEVHARNVTTTAYRVSVFTSFSRRDLVSNYELKNRARRWFLRTMQWPGMCGTSAAWSWSPVPSASSEWPSPMPTSPKVAAIRVASPACVPASISSSRSRPMIPPFPAKSSVEMARCFGAKPGHCS